MTAPPDRMWAREARDLDHHLIDRWYDVGTADHPRQYVLLDGPTMQAAIAAARAEGREQGLREAADSLLECSVWCDSQDRTDDGWRNGVKDARKHHTARILALIPAPPPADGDDTLASVLSYLALRQEPLGAEFERALDADREGLYEP